MLRQLRRQITKPKTQAMELLINDVKTLKQFLGGVQRNMDWSTWQPFVESAQETFILAAVGEGLIADLSGTHETVLTLKKKLQRTLANYAYLIAIPQLTVVTGDAGILQPNPQNTTTLTKWMHTNLSQTTAKTADDNLELALQFLERNTDVQDDNQAYVFANWRNGDVYLKNRGSFVSSATELTKYLPFVQNSRRLFLAMRDYFERAAVDYLPDLVGEAFTNSLKLRLLSDVAMTQDELKVIDYVRMVIVYKSLEDAITFLNISPDFRLITLTDGLQNEGMIAPQRANQIMLDAQKSYERFGSKLTDLLNKKATATVFADYFTSEFYPLPTAEKDAKGRFLKRFDDPTRNFVVL
jgi:hypothetical protein